MSTFPITFAAPLGDGDAVPVEPASAGGGACLGFEVAIFTGDDPGAAQNRLRTIECGPDIRDAVIAVSAGEQALTARAAVRARYYDGGYSPWRISASDVIDAHTSPVEQARADAANALTLAGSATRVFFQTSAPTSGMVADDLWYDTTSYVDSDGQTKKRYQPYRFDGAVWVALDKKLIVASEIAAGAIVADKIDTNAVTAAKIQAGAITTEKLDALAVTAEKIAVGAITAEKIQAGQVTADKLEANAIKTSNFASSGSGVTEYATAGAKLQSDGAALLVAPANLKIGRVAIEAGSIGWAKASIQCSEGVYTVQRGKGVTGASRVAFGGFNTDKPEYAIQIDFSSTLVQQLSSGPVVHVTHGEPVSGLMTVPRLSVPKVVSSTYTYNAATGKSWLSSVIVGLNTYDGLWMDPVGHSFRLEISVVAEWPS